MALNVARFEHAGCTQWGVVHGDALLPVAGDFATTGDFVRAADLAALRALENSGGPTLPLAECTLLAPVTRNQQFVCQGANYRQHMIESGIDPDAKHYNMLFTKAPGCIVAHDADIVRPAHVRLLDYEIELGLVLRRDVTGPVDVTAANLHEFIAGLVMVNDVSARDVQVPQGQFYKGKSYRSFGPVGPWLCLLDAADMPRLAALELRLTVNGAVRQHDSTANMVFGPVATLNELARLHDLAAGDLIATGTPAGCALAVPSPAKQRLAALLPEARKWALFARAQAGRPYLQPGDVVEASIHSSDGVIDLGTQRNRVVAAHPNADKTEIASR